MAGKIAPILTILLLTGCAPIHPTPSAMARLAPTTGNSVRGLVQFVQKGSNVLVFGEVTGLKPNSMAGFHLHETGDCSSGDGLSAGAHFNPLGKAHGGHDHAEHHAGDFPNLLADAAGVARFWFESASITLGGQFDVLTRGLIVHRDPDDLKSQPTGNSGPRVACAAITLN